MLFTMNELSMFTAVRFAFKASFALHAAFTYNAGQKVRRFVPAFFPHTSKVLFVPFPQIQC